MDILLEKIAAQSIQKSQVRKRQLVLDQGQRVSNHLKYIVSDIVTSRNNGLIFLQDDLKICLSEKSPRKSSALNLTTKELEMNGFGEGFPLGEKPNPSSLNIFPQLHKRVTKFIDESGFKLFHPTERKGLWQHVIMCENEIGDVMITVIGKITKEYKNKPFSSEMPNLILNLKQCFKDVGSYLKTLALVFETQYGDIVTVPVIGDGFLNQQVESLNVKIHASAPQWLEFSGIKLLTDIILKLTTSTTDSTYSVIQLGVGYVYVTFDISKACKMVLVLDKLKEQGEAIVSTAEENGIHNIKYVSDSIIKSGWSCISEHHLEHCKNICVLVNESHGDELDPLQLRYKNEIKKIIWIVKCSNVPYEKLSTLCKEEENSEPFIVVRAVPVDMAPNKINIKIVYLLVRKSLILNKIERNLHYVKDEEHNCDDRFTSLKYSANHWDSETEEWLKDYIQYYDRTVSNAEF